MLNAFVWCSGVEFEFKLTQAEDVYSFLNELFVCVRSGANSSSALTTYFCERALRGVSHDYITLAKTWARYRLVKCAVLTEYSVKAFSVYWLLMSRLMCLQKFVNFV